MITNRRKLGVCAFAPVIVAAVVCAVRTSVKQTLLLDRSARIINGQGSRAFDTSSYYWLSDHEVLLARRYLAEGGVRTDGVAPQTLVTCDITTGRESSMSSLSRLFNSSNGTLLPNGVSPNGKWVSWSAFGYDLSKVDKMPDACLEGIFGSTYVAKMDGSVSWQWPNDGGTVGFDWTPDSRQWAEYVWVRRGTTIDHIHTRNLANPRAVQTKHLTRAAQLALRYPFVTLTDNRVLTFNGRCENGTSTFEVSETRFDPASFTSYRYTIALPRYARVCEIQFSPRRDRIAWLLKGAYVSRVDSLLQRLVPGYAIPGRVVMSLWVSGVDGSGMHVVGAMGPADEPKPGPNPTAAPITDPSNVKWVPDNQRLSFIHAGSLWTVPCG